MKKTGDGRFIEKRVLVNKILLKELIFTVKNNNNLTWNDFAKKFNVTSMMLQHDWLIKGRTIPLSVFKRIVKLSGKNIDNKSIKVILPFWGQKIIKGKPKLKKVKIPNKNDKPFSEFYGILLGDGCIFSDRKGLSISGDKFLDYPYYVEYIKCLIFDLFGITPSFYFSKKDRSIKCVVYSKLIVDILNKTNFPIGVKYDKKPRIPKFMFNKKDNLAACIRGIMDTDGSLAAHPHSKIMIHLSITISSLRKSVLSGLKRLGIPAGEFNKGIMIYGKEKVKLFEKVIGFSNNKNIYKYSTFLKTGKVPSSIETEMFIREKEGI